MFGKAPDGRSDGRRTNKKGGLQDSNLEPREFRGPPEQARLLSSQGRAEWTRYPADITPRPPAWGTPAWRGWAHCGALWCFPL